MSSVRLYKRQIERFSHGNGAKVIACALRRYRDGELVIGSGSHDKDPGTYYNCSRSGKSRTCRTPCFGRSSMPISIRRGRSWIGRFRGLTG